MPLRLLALQQPYVVYSPDDDIIPGVRSKDLPVPAGECEEASSFESAHDAATELLNQFAFEVDTADAFFDPTILDSYAEQIFEKACAAAKSFFELQQDGVIPTAGGAKQGLVLRFEGPEGHKQLHGAQKLAANIGKPLYVANLGAIREANGGTAASNLTALLESAAARGVVLYIPYFSELADPSGEARADGFFAHATTELSRFPGITIMRDGTNAYLSLATQLTVNFSNPRSTRAFELALRNVEWPVKGFDEDVEGRTALEWFLESTSPEQFENAIAVAVSYLKTTAPTQPLTPLLLATTLRENGVSSYNVPGIVSNFRQHFAGDTQ